MPRSPRRRIPIAHDQGTTAMWYWPVRPPHRRFPSGPPGLLFAQRYRCQYPSFSITASPLPEIFQPPRPYVVDAALQCLGFLYRCLRCRRSRIFDSDSRLGMQRCRSIQMRVLARPSGTALRFCSHCHCRPGTRRSVLEHGAVRRHEIRSRARDGRVQQRKGEAAF